ncbi:hypothetical protein [Amycolatopsis sp. H20-H5]|uniref:hypothetical protein n=1 Tax=Amycolatopsis sp. H20-H5 TaxID=3046309 RepID=UPI002DBFC153|nr:hypothetical protein [Amycolatopsis sp. H20-H5]MEC3977141.1 hypothetical protein [Amycolatopsis sp. H20-H5]
MAYEEKRAWIMAVVAVAAYAVYLAVVLARASGRPLAEVPYVTALLWTVGAAILATIVLNIVARIASPRDSGRADQRDREIGRFGEHLGQSFVVLGAVAALVMALAEVRYFWIANAVCLAFFLSAILGSAAKIVAYRRGFQPW